MSVLSSTHSGLESPLTVNILISMGYSKSMEKFSGIDYYSNPKYDGLSIEYNQKENKFRFMFKSSMCVKRPEDRLRDDVCLIFEKGAHVKLLHNFLEEQNIKIKRNLENKLLLLEEKIEHDDSLWNLSSAETYSHYKYSHREYNYKEDYEFGTSKYYKLPKRNYKWW